MYKILLACSLLLTACVPGYKYTLRENNDYFKVTENNDRDFTQGLRLSAENNKNEYYIQQLVYTPAKPGKRSATQIDGQRPYAGYLAVGYKRHTLDSPTVQDTLGLEAGVVGPHAFGKQTQLGVHKALGQLYPLGWDNQLKDEPIVSLTAERRNILFTQKYFDFSSLVGANGGNLISQLYLGGTARCGYNLQPYYHTVLYPRAPRNESAPYSVYLFADVLGRFVARNIFLDGNSFVSSASVDSEPFVRELHIGLVAEYGDYSAGYVYEKQSREYTTEEHGADFGEVFFSIKY